MIAVRRSGSSMVPIGSWTADATCSEGHVVSRGGLRGGRRGEGWHQCVVGLLSPLALRFNL